MDINSIVMGFVVAILLMSLGIIITKVVKKKKVTDDDIFDILNEYKSELIKLVQTAIDIVSIDSTLSDEEFRARILGLSTQYFREFLATQTEIPQFIIDIITTENLETVIDTIIQKYEPVLSTTEIEDEILIINTSESIEDDISDEKIDISKHL